MTARTYHVVTVQGVPGFHVVCRQEAHPDWMRILATFSDKDRADAYADVENDCDHDSELGGEIWRQDAAEAPPALPPPEDMLRAWLYLRDMDRLEIERLQRQIASPAKTDANYADPIPAIAAPAPAEAAPDGGEENGEKTASSPPDQTPCPQADPSAEATSPGAPPPAESARDTGAASDAEAPGLTDAQRRLLDALRGLVGTAGGKAKHSDMAAASGVPRGSLGFQLSALESKGLIAIEGSLGSPSYRVIEQCDGRASEKVGKSALKPNTPIKSKQDPEARDRAIEAQRRAKAAPQATQPGHRICRACGEEFEPARPDAFSCARCVSRVAGSPKPPTNLTGGKWS